MRGADAVWSSPSSHSSSGGSEKIARGGQKTAGATLFPLLRRSSNFHFHYTAAWCVCVVLAGHELFANLAGNNNFLHNYDQEECPHSSGAAGFIQLLGVRGMQVEKSFPHLKRRNMAGTTFEEYYTSVTDQPSGPTQTLPKQVKKPRRRMPPEPLFPAEPPPKPATAEMETQTDPQDMGLIYDPETDQYLTPEQLRGREEALRLAGLDPNSFVDPNLLLDPSLVQPQFDQFGNPIFPPPPGPEPIVSPIPGQNEYGHSGLERHDDEDALNGGGPQPRPVDPNDPNDPLRLRPQPPPRQPPGEATVTLFKSHFVHDGRIEPLAVRGGSPFGGFRGKGGGKGSGGARRQTRAAPIGGRGPGAGRGGAPRGLS
ncbi:unnamed protein product [Amoebophrya sp. A120]|nr:unnamed protein product [Amoebophrya sp. A120]|eukprot:GSA120T00016280001.1